MFTDDSKTGTFTGTSHSLWGSAAFAAASTSTSASGARLREKVEHLKEALSKKSSFRKPL
jgi:hypothetical protein